ADRPGAEDDDRVAFLDVAHLRGLVAGGADVGEQRRVFDVHPVRDDRGPDVGHGHAHEFGLAAVVAAGRVRVAVDAAHRGGLRVDVVAVAVQLLLAEEARAAEDVEGHQHVVALLQVLHRRADLLDDAGELVAEGHAHARVGYQAVVQVQVGAADARARHAHDGIVGVFDFRLLLVRDAHAVGAAVIHSQHGTSSWSGPAIFGSASAALVR